MKNDPCSLDVGPQMVTDVGYFSASPEVNSEGLTTVGNSEVEPELTGLPPVQTLAETFNHSRCGTKSWRHSCS